MAIVQLQIEIFMIVICGYILAKKNIMNVDTRKRLTDIVINLILPCAIIKSFSMKMTSDIIQNTAIIFLASFAIQLVYSVLNKFLYRHFDEHQAIIMKYATIVSNAGFMGLPIVESVYGGQGLLYASIALIPQRIFMWSAGLSLFTTTNRKQALHSIAFHPCIIAVYIGVIIMGLESANVVVPSVFMDTISTIGGCTTTMSMLIIGAILSDVKWNELIEKSSLYFSFIRLLAIPIFVFICLSLLHLDGLVIGVSVLLSAMPAGSTAAMLAQKYDKDVIYASKIIVLSTVLSLITLPVISVMLNQ